MSNVGVIGNVIANATKVSSHTYHIEKLNDKNDQPWHMTIEIILEQYNLLNIVDGTGPCPNIIVLQMHLMCKHGSSVI